MGIKDGIKVEISTKDILVVSIIVVIFVVSVLTFKGQIFAFLKSFSDPKSIVVLNGGLIAGLIALFVGYSSIRAIHNQIADSQAAREEHRKDAARIYLAAVVSFLTQFDREIRNTVNYNSQNRFDDGMVIHPTSYAVLTGGEILGLVNNWEFYMRLPPGETRKFLQLRLNVLICLQVVNVSAVELNGRILVTHETWNRFAEIAGEKFKEIDVLVKEIYDDHPDLRP